MTQISNPEDLHCRLLLPHLLSVSPSRFLIGNKNDLRDPTKTDHQVGQDRAMSFAKTHGMIFFETSAKNPPKRRGNGQRGEEALRYQQDDVDDIVTAVGAVLRKRKNPSTANSPAYSGSFKVGKKKAEKELWTCC